MFVNSISGVRNIFTTKQLNQNPAHMTPAIKNNGVDTVSFKGRNPEITRNEFKILLCQDIWAKSLKVKMPESPLEKEVLLEILQHRLRLDRFTRLNNDRANFKIHQKAIELETKKNKSDFAYFNEIQKLEDEYLEKRLIKTGAINKFMDRVNKYNINREEKYSTQDLIDIITKSENPIASATVKAVSKPTTKKQFLAHFETEYEKKLKEEMNVFENCVYGLNSLTEIPPTLSVNPQNLRQSVFKENIELVNKFLVPKKQLIQIFEKTENKFKRKMEIVADTDIYPIGDIWAEMRKVENSIKKTMQKLDELKMSKSPEDKKTIELIHENEKELQRLKDEWLQGVETSLECHRMNCELMSQAGKLNDFKYLIDENKTLKKHTDVSEIMKKNNNVLPEDMWAQVLS